MHRVTRRFLEESEIGLTDRDEDGQLKVDEPYQAELLRLVKDDSPADHHHHHHRPPLAPRVAAVGDGADQGHSHYSEPDEPSAAKSRRFTWESADRWWPVRGNILSRRCLWHLEHVTEPS